MKEVKKNNRRPQACSIWGSPAHHLNSAIPDGGVARPGFGQKSSVWRAALAQGCFNFPMVQKFAGADVIARCFCTMGAHQRLQQTAGASTCTEKTRLPIGGKPAEALKGKSGLRMFIR